MTANENSVNFETQELPSSAGKSIDLQGVASFASLVELLAQELGTTSGKIQGHLPNGPASFEQLVGEIPVTSHGYNRHVTLLSTPGGRLRLRIFCSLREPSPELARQAHGVEAQIILSSPVERILPQGRALARHLEELFAVLDKMATLGMASKLSAMSVSEAELARFEQQEGAGLVKSYTPRTESAR